MASISALSIPGSLTVTKSTLAIATDFSQNLTVSYQEITRDAEVTQQTIANYIMVTADVNSKITANSASSTNDDTFTLAGFGLKQSVPDGNTDNGELAWTNETIKLPLISASGLSVGTLTLQSPDVDVSISQGGTSGATFTVTMSLTSVASGIMTALMSVTGSTASATATENVTTAQKVAVTSDSSFTKDSADSLTVEITSSSVLNFADSSPAQAGETVGEAMNVIKNTYNGQTFLTSWSGTFDAIESSDSAFESFSEACRSGIANGGTVDSPIVAGTNFVAATPHSLSLSITDSEGASQSLISATNVYMIVKQS